MALLEMFQYAQANTGNVFGSMMLFSLYSIIFINIMVNRGGREFATAFVSAGTITAFVGIFLRVAGLVTDKVLFTAIAGCVIPILISLFMPRN